ncbi:hypothetical protein [Verticiella sediminum]|nr:hypothetical protein [Verticiella sediminum]
MDMESGNGFFAWLGELVGGAIRFVVDALRSLFGGLAGAVDDFLSGVAGAFGMSPGLFNYVWLILGVLMLIAAIRAVMRRAIVAAVVWAVLGVFVLGMLVGG